MNKMKNSSCGRNLDLLFEERMKKHRKPKFFFVPMSFKSHFSFLAIFHI